MVKPWGVYILQCSDLSMYCGISNDIERRLSKHNAGKGAKYTRGRLPVELVYFEVVGSKREALRREFAIKRMPRNKKLSMATEWSWQALAGGYK